MGTKSVLKRQLLDQGAALIWHNVDAQCSAILQGATMVVNLKNFGLALLIPTGAVSKFTLIARYCVDHAPIPSALKNGTNKFRAGVINAECKRSIPDRSSFFLSFYLFNFLN